MSITGYQLNGSSSLNQALGMQFAPAILGGQTRMVLSGTKHLVVCNGNTFECDTMDEAQMQAEEFAHKHSATAYILKPVRKVSPKREVVTSDLP